MIEAFEGLRRASEVRRDMGEKIFVDIQNNFAP